MMNQTLQRELSSHFKKIKERRKKLDRIEKSLNLKNNSFEDFKEEIKIELVKRVKEYLDKNKFDYEKGRNSKGTRITFKDGNIKTRDYGRHGFLDFDFLNSDELDEFLPKGLIETRHIINQKLAEIDNVILEFKDKIKLKQGIDIQYIDSEELVKEKIKEIGVSFNCEEEHYHSGRSSYSNYYNYENSYKTRSERFEIELDGHTYLVDYALYSDEVFNNILFLIEKFKKHIKEIKDIKEEKKADLRDFTFNQISKLIVLGGLGDE